jgi:hypothetical protein
MAQQTTESTQGVPDVQLVYGGACVLSCVVIDVYRYIRPEAHHHHHRRDPLVHIHPHPATTPTYIYPHIYISSSGLKRPNGLAFSPDFHTLYIANSDGDDPKWLALPIDPHTGLVTEGREPWVLAAATTFQAADGSLVGNP